MDEHRPLLLSAPRDLAITIHGESSDEYDVSPRYFQQLDQREHVQAQAQATLLSRKYVTYPVEDVVGQKRSRSKVAVAGYGTMAVKPEDEDGNGQSTKKKTAAPSSLRSLLCKMDDPRKTKSCSSFNPEHLPSNQSETESDSDGSCGSNTTSSNSSSSSSLQSILRIRDGIYACRKVRKQVSVEFSLDVDYKDIDDEADERRKGSKASGLLCASNCMPRRLTIEEKAALYRIRPDLQLTPMPLILRELEEIRRRRQRKLMFSILGGTLIMLMIIVFYYLLTETP
jgi:hypothetical protein